MNPFQNPLPAENAGFPSEKGGTEGNVAVATLTSVLAFAAGKTVLFRGNGVLKWVQ